MLRGIIDQFVGRGEAAVTVPPMDGALRPNQALEQAVVVAEAPAPDNLVSHGGEILFSTGRELRKLETNTVVRSFDRTITCVAAAPDGHLAVGLSGGGVLIVQPDDAVSSYADRGNIARDGTGVPRRCSHRLPGLDTPRPRSVEARPDGSRHRQSRARARWF